ncbi:outer membrane beta-barrel protein [Xanthomarina sp. F2636L]|uniref:outer membrane beta-barrel protein n=1 Tax=Xanthomarina sp. F2636L TaxID=2996018 RepID=UPI00225E673B|nr:outer membrane beta-barrel protein [Xanthomarina sp. F2636L]MCX7552075.1 outer membrane beta-barrel protein [Xanthomarina sp. F2636L]
MKYFFFTLVFLWVSIVFSQSNKFQISGTVISAEDQSPLESATVHLERVKDSTVITYTITDKDGRFSLEDKINDTQVNLYISYVGYKTYFKKIELSKEIIQLNTLSLEVNSNALNEVLITSQAPITLKKDTLEFNVKSFKTKKDATVEDLLKELPGVEVGEDGKIKVNGKEVSKILVNGKPFFGDDPTITTKNLTKDIIDKVQIVDTKTKSEAFTGEETDGEDKTINLTISEDKNKGVFGRVAAGGGTDERYEFAGMLNYFNNDQRVSVLAGGNNINSPGFSFGEIQKMFGHANSMSISSTGAFTIDGRSFGGGAGITKSQNVGANYADVIGKKTDVSADYFHSGSISENETATQRENILPDSRYYTNSRNSSYNNSNSHSANLGFDIEVDSTLLINIVPSFRYSKSENTYNGYEESLNNSKVLTNESTSNSKVDNLANNFSNNLSVTKKFGSKGGFIKAKVNFELISRESDDYLNSLTNIYGEDLLDPTNPDYVLIDQTSRDQFTDGNGNTNTLSTTLSYRLPLIDKKLFIDFDYNYSNTKTDDTKSTFDKDAEGNYNIFNQALSTDFEYTDETSVPGMSLSYRVDKFSASFGASYLFRTLGNNDLLRPEFNIERKFENIQLNSNIRYKLSNKTSVSVSYRLRSSPPELYQLQAFANVSDPLNTIVGNPNLEPETKHNFYGSFNAFDFQKRTGFYGYFGLAFTDNKVVSRSIITEDLERVTTYANVNGDYSGFGGVDYSKKINLDSLRTVKVGLGLNGNIYRNVNFNNGVQYASHVNSLTPEIDFTFEWKGIFEIRPRYSIRFTNNKYNLETFEDTSFLFHQLRITSALFLPKNFEWRNDVKYNYDPSISSSFQQSAWFWNSSLAYSFMQDKALMTLKVYDLLNQNTNARRSATQNYIQDSQSSVLQRYFMLSFSWKFNSLGKKGESGNDDMYFFD